MSVREEQMLLLHEPSTVRLVRRVHVRDRERVVRKLFREPVRALPLVVLGADESRDDGWMRLWSALLEEAYFIAAEHPIRQSESPPAMRPITYTIHVQDRPELSIEVSVQNSCVGSYVPKQVLWKGVNAGRKEKVIWQRTRHRHRRTLHTTVIRDHDLTCKEGQLTVWVVRLRPERAPCLESVLQSPALRTSANAVLYFEGIAELEEGATPRRGRKGLPIPEVVADCGRRAQR